MSTPACVLANVTKTFELGRETVVAVDDVDLRVECGEFVTIFGVSGSGKSTLLRLIAGLDRATAGSVRVLGTDLNSLDDRSLGSFRLRNVGVVFQDNQLIEEFTALENVILPLLAAGVGRAAAEAEAVKLLGELGIAGLAGRSIEQMSGGQRQRVGIARALAGERPVLLADEPTGALDSGNAHALFASLRGLADGGRAIVTATHDPRALDYATHNYVIDDGRLRLRENVT
ncbi:unannotated protein [freshwater metagenome]|uniref:Unannotated protein n=1 Tax=freshwater metagenome TaxID=449393 RepID=A0A6J6CF65_9ZZZZ